MMKLNFLNNLSSFMLLTLLITLLTIKTSIMCISLMTYIYLAATTISFIIKMTPAPYIIFLTMIGGLMIIFLYFIVTIWKKKEIITLKMKILMLFMLMMPTSWFLTNNLNQINNQAFNMVFSIEYNPVTLLILTILLLVFMYTIEIHMKPNKLARQKLQTWM